MKTRAPGGICVVFGSCFGCSTPRMTEAEEAAGLLGAERYLDILRRVHEHGAVPLHRDTSHHGMRARRQENRAMGLDENVSLGPSRYVTATAESAYG